MKTILVTGGLGFIGSNFLNSYVLSNLDKKIINIDSESYASSFESTKNLILDKGVIGESYCIGSNNEISNIDLIKKICKISDNFLDNNLNSFELVKFIKDRPGHDIRYSIDSSKLQKLGWKPINSFDESLKRTIKWYIDNPNWLN